MYVYISDLLGCVVGVSALNSMSIIKYKDSPRIGCLVYALTISSLYQGSPTNLA